MSLWDILLFEGIFSCPSQEEISKLIMNLESNSLIFFKSLLELDMANMISILSFDSKIVKSLLRENNVVKIDH